jgi:hypothetical protein
MKIYEYDSISELIFELDNLSTTDFNHEWDCLVDNYSKLKYLETIHYEILINDTLIKSLTRFMEQMDKVSQHYLKEILWEKSLIPIKKNLANSLNNNNPIVKLNYLIKAYDLLVPVVEDIRKQKCVQQIEDDEFIQTFKKRRTY